jgi:hypothetical protein
MKTLTIITLAALAVTALANDVRELTWEDLIPGSVEFEDPFAQLDREQLEYLGFVARVRAMLAADNQVSESTIAEMAEIEAELVADGIDIDGLLARRDETRELRRRRAGAVVEELDATAIRMAGYLLPLDYSGRRVTEFLLVPWVGACIHTPPPPPNQIVHVVLDEENAFESRSLFEPVWASGVLSTRRSTRNLFLKDGSSDIEISYRLQAGQVEVFRQ